MAGIFSGLEKFGLGNLNSQDIFEDPDKNKNAEAEKQPVKKAPVRIQEKDYLFDKKYQCPVCDTEFTSKTVRTGKIRMKSVDIDLRPDYDEVDMLKYDVIACPECGYAALGRYFGGLTRMQIDEIRRRICMNYKKHKNPDDIYTYDYSAGLYQIALANAVVKKAKNSEKAYLCLKTAWVYRGQREHLDQNAADYKEKSAALEAQEKELLKNALNGFVMARQTEEFPIAGMDSMTLDYLIAALAVETDDFNVASKMVSEILTSRAASSRMKDKARILKDMMTEKSGAAKE